MPDHCKDLQLEKNKSRKESYNFHNNLPRAARLSWDPPLHHFWFEDTFGTHIEFQKGEFHLLVKALEWGQKLHKKIQYFFLPHICPVH